MFLKTDVLLLVVNIQIAQLLYKHDSLCDSKHSLTIGEVYTFYNPLWPYYYRPGVKCRWIFDCPLGFVCNLDCYFIDIPRSKGCLVDKLLVSIDGNKRLKNSTAYCGRTYFRVQSTRTRITMALHSSHESNGGRFTCTVTSQAVITFNPSSVFFTGTLCHNENIYNSRSSFCLHDLANLKHTTANDITEQKRTKLLKKRKTLKKKKRLEERKPLVFNEPESVSDDISTYDNIGFLFDAF